MKRDRLGGASRVLAVRLDTIGDVVMTTPALGALADAGLEVTLLTSTVSSSLASMLPYLTDLITLDVPWMKPAEKNPVSAEAHLGRLDALRERAFDAAVIFTVSTQNPACAAYLCHLAGIPRVATYAREKLYGLATDAIADPDDWPPARHEVVRQIELVEALGFPVNDRSLRLAVPSASRAVRALVERAGSDWCVVHPGATAASRRYPAEQWSVAIDLLHAEGVRVVLAGGRQDKERCSQIASACRTPPLRADARLSLTELASLLAEAPVAATCNSSAAHLCAAAGTPVVTLYAGTNPQHRPWGRRVTVLRRHTECTWCLSSACRHGEPLCIASVSPSRVAESVLAQLRAVTSSSALVARQADPAR